MCIHHLSLSDIFDSDFLFKIMTNVASLKYIFVAAQVANPQTP